MTRVRRVASPALAGLVWFTGGCTMIWGTEAPVEPGPVPRPEIEVAGESVAPLVQVAYLTPPVGEPMVDELLASPVLRDPEFRQEVEQWIDYWRGPARRWFPDYLRRMGAFELTVDSALAARRMPPSLRYLPLIESGYSPSARSSASAVGLWQFMAGTAREHGMEVGAFVDQRRDPFMATAAATEYLERLYERFGSWFMVLAAYNGGPNRAGRIIRERAPLATPSDSLFWAHRDAWPRETREFVPKLVSAIIVSQNPTEYGYEPPVRDLPFRYDRAMVPDATTLDVLAEAAETSEEEMRRLNPELYRGFTPPGSAYSIRVPVGRAPSFEARYAAIPADRRLTVVEHVVQQGETLSHIALRYGVSVSDLEAANPGIRPRYLRLGARLTVPITLARGG